MKVRYQRIDSPVHKHLIRANKIIRESTAKNPIQLCWELYGNLKKEQGEKFSRKAAIDRAMQLGVAFYTARTQYQEWKSAGDRDLAASLKRYGTP